MKDLRKYDLVVMNHNDNAALWRVKEIDGKRVGVVDAESKRRDLRVQYCDSSLLMRPTRTQLARVE